MAGGNTAHGSIKVSSSATKNGVKSSVWSGGSTRGTAAVLLAGGGHAQNRDSEATVDQDMAIISYGRGSASGSGDTTASHRRGKGSKVNSSIRGGANNDGLVAISSEGFAGGPDGASAGKAGLSVDALSGGSAYGSLSGDTRGNRRRVKSNLRASGTAKNGGSVAGVGEFGSAGGKHGDLSDVVYGDLRVDAGPKRRGGY